MADHAAKTTSLALSNKAYDVLKRTVEYVLPGLGTLYFTVATIWGLPYGEQVVGTLAAVAIFLAIFLGFSRKSFKEDERKYDGALVVDTKDPLKDTYSLELDGPLEDVQTRKEIILKVWNPHDEDSR